MKGQKGFTLIELLISIAIIGILTAVVLGGVDMARAKARDAKIKSQLNSIRTAAQNYYNSQVPSDYTNAATCSAGMFISTDFGMSQLTSYENYPGDTELRCAADGQSYAVWASLSTPGEYWCVDPSGSKELFSDPGSVTVCP